MNPNPNKMHNDELVKEFKRLEMDATAASTEASDAIPDPNMDLRDSSI